MKLHAQHPLAVAAILAAAPASLFAQTLSPNHLVVSRSVYDNNPANITVGQSLPPNCASTVAGCGTGANTATYNGTYPYVFNNDKVDGSFGITSSIFLDQINLFGTPINTIAVPSTATGSTQHLVTSFSSKSELALHLSTNNQFLTFMGYVAPINTLRIQLQHAASHRYVQS